jgi:hypothetical protein
MRNNLFVRCRADCLFAVVHGGFPLRERTL